MKQRRRIYYSAVQRSEIWDRWQAGESMRSIERRFDRASSSVFSVIFRQWHSSPTGSAPRQANVGTKSFGHAGDPDDRLLRVSVR
jgi:hypothetical protein